MLPSKAGTSVPSVSLHVIVYLTVRDLFPWLKDCENLFLFLSLPPLWHHGAWELRSCLKYLVSEETPSPIVVELLEGFPSVLPGL